MIRVLAEDTDVWADDTWLIDSTPMECGRSRPTRTFQPRRLGRLRLLRFSLAVLLGAAAAPGVHPGRAADHVRVANPKVDERDVAIDMFETEPGLLVGRHGQTIIADKGYASAEFERRLAAHGIELSARRVPTSPTTRRSPVARPATDHRVGKQHPEGPAQPRRPRWAHNTGGRRSRPHLVVDFDCRDLAQPPQRAARPAMLTASPRHPYG